MKRDGYKSVRVGAVAILSSVLACGVFAHAQELNPTADPQTARTGIQNGGRPVGELNGQPLYRVNVVKRNLDAVNYKHRSGDTKLDMNGTALLAGAKGDAKVNSDKGRITVDLDVDHLPPANGFGPEYLTYVLWAITPDGAPTNLGEVLPAGGSQRVKMNVTVPLQSFGLIITAEPYFAVKVPSDVVVMENHVIEGKTNGVIEHVDAHYTLLPKGLYAQTDGAKTVFRPITRDEHSPLELYEAHNAYQIAMLAGADKYASDIMAQVKTNLDNADAMDMNKHRDEKMEITMAREAVQRSEDARISTLRKKETERQIAEVNARKDAQAQAAAAQLAAQQQALDAERARASADRAAAERARAEANAANADAAAAAAKAQADAARQDVVAMREKLRAQLNAVLATQETARGLVVTLGDVLFDTGKSSLKQNAQISLAKVSAILQQYPDLKLQIEGYTDAIGGDAYNLKLSEDRANSTQAFLVNNGVSPTNVSSLGFGKSNPVADNGTSSGRAQNRRVEMVVSGPSIGVKTQAEPTVGQ
ncbi:OmpA family protein [Terriglobus roseus]|uniref:Outer membrane protein OmpA n=1 Tax=Terriglobus roseus TaxID=392734 RepID=A0A1G7EWH7_9BACT|nr:OmpA family protein [Terriglobus roseus]SDE68019.1 Outer membrane protein OmpA [Terriglobus roseus]